MHEVLREPGRGPAATLPGPASLLPMPRPAPPPAQPAAVRRLPDAKGPLCSPHGSSGHLKRLPSPSRPLPGAPLGPEPREGGVLHVLLATHARAWNGAGTWVPSICGPAGAQAWPQTFPLLWT